MTINNAAPLGFAAHPRNWRNFRLVYPVVSRRSKGLSIGINLNPDRVCNFDCIYCEVDRQDFRPGLVRLPPLGIVRPVVDLKQIELELGQILAMAKSGAIWQEPEFRDVRPEMQRLNDIAFSGDGEPTTYPRFAAAVQVAIDLRKQAGYALEEVKIVLITNATELNRERVKTGLELLAHNNGEIWAKLDAGTSEYYRIIDKTNVSYERILQNILETAQRQVINVQTMFLRLDGASPSPVEIQAYCQRLQKIVAEGGKIKLVQIYTVSRTPAQSNVSSLTNRELDVIAEKVRQSTSLAVETYYGAVGI